MPGVSCQRQQGRVGALPILAKNKEKIYNYKAWGGGVIRPLIVEPLKKLFFWCVFPYLGCVNFSLIGGNSVFQSTLNDNNCVQGQGKNLKMCNLYSKK